MSSATSGQPSDPFTDEIGQTLRLLSVTARPARAKGLTQLLDLQEQCYGRAMMAKTSHEDVAALTRAFCLLEERIRIRRGIPLPGQLRPDLPPFKRASKGQRQRLIDVMSDASETAARMVDDEPAAEPAEAETQTPTPPTTPTPDRAYVPSPIPEKGKAQKPTGETLAGEATPKKESL